MPNTIKFGSYTGESLKVGDALIGVRDVSKGPTSTTGFYNGINPPSDGYTIYQNKTSQGPSIICPSNNADLILVTNGIAGTAFTTPNQCFAYFAGQSDKFVMFNPIRTLITNGLVLCLNANIIPSYPKSGTTWYDLSGEVNDGTLINGPTFNGNGWIEFDGIDDYGTTNDVTSDLVSSDFTFLALIRGGTQDHKSIFSINTSGGGNRVLWMVRSAGMGIYDNSQWYIGSIDVDNNKWHQVVATYDYSTKNLKTYTDGVNDLNVTTNIQINIQSSDKASIAMEFDGSSPSDLFNGDISQVVVYDRVLSSEEVLQNYYQGLIYEDDLAFAIDAGNLVSYTPGATTVYSLLDSGNLQGTLGDVDFNPNFSGIWEFGNASSNIEINAYTFGSGNWAVNMWVKFNDVSSNILLLNWDVPQQATNYFEMQDGKIAYSNLGDQFYTNSGTTALPEGEWCMLTWVNFGNIADPKTNTMLMYVNGEVDSSVFNSYTSGTAGTNGNGTCNVICKNSQNPDTSIASVQFYDDSLTAAEIQQNYNANVNLYN